MERLLNVAIEDEMKRSYIDYAMSVIASRALPDVRDGLKPVHRRILYAMHELGLTPDKPFKKSATVVGECLGKFHPHGDLAVYDAITRMVQDFSLRYPLIEGQGNFGSIDGDGAAAYRYTEIRLSKLALYLLNDIEKDTVNLVPNFDGRLKEPVVLPASFPNLLVNGTSGIAVGMATNIPPHNMGEVIDAIIAMIENPDIDPLSYIKGPDFPTGGIIVGRSGITDYVLTGRGKITVKARVKIEETEKGKAICIIEIPYQVNKSSLIERIAEVIKERKIEDVTTLRDESDREGMRIVIEIKKNANEELILNNLYKHTAMKTTFGVNLLALKSGIPVTSPLRDMLSSFIEHRYEVVEKRTKFELDKAEKKAHILEGLKIAIEHIDEVVNIIKKAKTVQEAKKKLMERFSLTEVQSQAILDMRLSRLVNLEREKLENTYKETIKEIERLRHILSSRETIYEVIKGSLIEVREKFADKRRTEIKEEEEELTIEDLIPDIEVVVMLTNRGYVKRCSLDTYRTQARGGSGTSGIKLTPDDFVSHLLVTTNHSKLILFTENGKAFNLKAYEIPEGTRVSRGKSINNFLGIPEDDRVVGITTPIGEAHPVFIATKTGIVKKIEVRKLVNIRRNGIRVVRLREGNNVVGVESVPPKGEVVLVTKKGKASRLNESSVRVMGRAAYGVIGMRLKEDDYVVALVLPPHKEKYLFVVTEDGYGKRVKIGKIRKTNRGSKGVMLVKGTVAGVIPVDDESEVICATQNGKIIKIRLKNVRVMGRVARGVRVISLKENDTVVAVDRVDR